MRECSIIRLLMGRAHLHPIKAIELIMQIFRRSTKSEWYSGLDKSGRDEKLIFLLLLDDSMD